uniref:Uncharacterized protein n=1 Tax=Mesocestoides corti TaxID=53468 RepID=A0A5K3FMQ6_MESCO
MRMNQRLPKQGQTGPLHRGLFTVPVGATTTRGGDRLVVRAGLTAAITQRNMLRQVCVKAPITSPNCCREDTATKRQANKLACHPHPPLPAEPCCHASPPPGVLTGVPLGCSTAPLLRGSPSSRTPPSICVLYLRLPSSCFSPLSPQCRSLELLRLISNFPTRK